jgi:hypothetical protein
MRRVRGLWWGVLALVGLGALLLAAIVVSAWWRGRSAGEALVARAIEVDRSLSAAAADPDSFAAKIAPQLDTLEQLHRRQPLDEKEAHGCKELAEDRPVSPEAAARCRSFVDARRSALASVLPVASLAKPGLPDGMSPYGDPKSPLAEDGFLRFLDLIRADAVLVHDEAAANQSQAAVRHCLDGLRLSRLMAPGGALLGAMMGYSGYQLLFASCAKAIGTGDPRDALGAADELEDARAEIPPLSEAIALENVVASLTAFGRFLPSSQQRELPPRAQAIAKAGEIGPVPAFGVVFAYDALDRLPRLTRETASAIDMPSAERVPALEELADEAKHSWNPIVKVGYSDYRKFADRYEQELALHDALLAIAKLRTKVFEDGHWPDQLGELYAKRPHLPTELRLTTRGEHGHALVAKAPIEPIIVPIEAAH